MARIEQRKVGDRIVTIKIIDEKPAYITITNDICGPSPEKRAQWDKDRAYVVLEVCAYDRTGTMIDSLSDIDFYDAAPQERDWVRGKFNRVSEIPAQCEHLRDIARDMELPE